MTKKRTITGIWSQDSTRNTPEKHVLLSVVYSLLPNHRDAVSHTSNADRVEWGFPKCHYFFFALYLKLESI